MRNRNDAWWTFSHSELSGVIVLLILLIGLFAFKVWFVPFYQQVDFPSEEELNKALVLFEKEKQEKKGFNDPVKEPFDFDPNQISKDSLLLLGFNEYLANRFINYRTAIGSFKSKEQVAKVYGLDSGQYARLLPYMKLNHIREIETASVSDSHWFSTSQVVKEVDAKVEVDKQIWTRQIDLNEADQKSFEKVYGIGEVLAERILKYRKLLGGFNSVEQIYEVYGVDSGKIDLESWQVSIALDKVIKIPINRADQGLLARHPYLSWKEAKVIVNFREQHGFYQSLDDLKRIEVIEASKIAQLTGYLSFEQ